MINYLNAENRNWMLALMMIAEKMEGLQVSLKLNKEDEEEKKLSSLMKRTHTQLCTVIDRIHNNLDPKSKKALVNTYLGSRVLIGPKLNYKKDEHFENWDNLISICCISATAMCDGCPGKEEEMKECILRNAFMHFNIPAFDTTVPAHTCQYRYCTEEIDASDIIK